MAALANADDGISALEGLNGLVDPAVHMGIADGLTRLSLREDFEFTEGQKERIRSIVANGFAIASTEKEQKALVDTIPKLRTLVDGLDPYLYASLGATRPESIRTSAVLALDLKKDEAFQALLSITQDSDEDVRRAGLSRLIEKLDDSRAQAIASQRIQAGSTEDRAAILYGASGLSYGTEMSEGERVRTRWVLELLAKSPEPQIREGAQKFLARLAEPQ